MSLVSIIIPCYNNHCTLRQTINSCLEQSYNNLEIIIVNDGSTQNIDSIINDYDDSRLKYLKQENKGVANARNNGIRKSSGDYIQFLDADDCLHPNKIEIQIKELMSEEYDISLCDICIINDSGSKIENISIENKILNENIFDILFMGGLFPPNVPLFKRKLLNNIKYFNEDRQIEYVADLDFWLRLFMDDNKYSYINLPLAYYRKSKDSMSSNLFEMNKQLDLCLNRIMASNPSRCFQSLKELGTKIKT